MDGTNVDDAALEDAEFQFGDTAVQYTYYGGFYGFGVSPVAAIGTTDESRVRFSVDVAGLGLDAAGTGTFNRMQVQFQANNATLREYEFFLDGAVTADGVFETFDFTLADGDLLVSDAALDAAFDNINFNFVAENYHNQFGFDGDNSLLIDNVRLETIAAVPEPGSLLLVAGVLGVCGAARRRRRLA